MVAVKTADLQNGFQQISDLVIAGETVLISYPHNQNLVVLSEKVYNELEKARRNSEYLASIDEAIQRIAEGRVVVKTIEELEEMAK
jgi:antitoxin YefM